MSTMLRRQFLLGAAGLVAGCGLVPNVSQPLTLYTLKPKLTAKDLPKVGWQLVVAEPAAERDRPRGDDDHRDALRFQRGQVFGQSGQPLAADLAVGTVDDGCRADLDRQPAIRPKGVSGHGILRALLFRQQRHSRESGNSGGARRRPKIRSGLPLSRE